MITLMTKIFSLNFTVVLSIVLTAGWASSGKADVLIKTRGASTGLPTLTIPQPIKFALIPGSNIPGTVEIVFQSVWTESPSSIIMSPSTTSLTLTSPEDPGILFLVNTWTSGGTSQGDIQATDSYITTYLFATGTTGEIATLTAGSYAFSYFGFPVFPTGNYRVFLADSNGNRVSADGVSDISVAPLAEPPIPGNTYYSWKVNAFSFEEILDSTISGENANPSGDGITNLQKYAFGLDPHQNVSVGKPVFSLVSQNGSTFPALTYRASAVIPQDLIYTVQFSSDLVNWFEAPENFTLFNTQSQVNGLNFLTYAATAFPSDQNPRTFMRLKVTEVSATQIFPSGGSSPQNVTITGAPNAVFYYTTDGSMPTQASTLYSSPFNIVFSRGGGSITLRVQSYMNGMPYGGIISATYTPVPRGG